MRLKSMTTMGNEPAIGAIIVVNLRYFLSSSSFQYTIQLPRNLIGSKYRLPVNVVSNRIFECDGSGQRSRHGTSSHPTRDIKNRTHSDSHKTSITRQISLFPWTNSWRRQGQHRLHWLTHFADKTTLPKPRKMITSKPVFRRTLWELLNPQTTTKISLNFATQFEMPCPAKRI